VIGQVLYSFGILSVSTQPVYQVAASSLLQICTSARILGTAFFFRTPPDLVSERTE